MEQKADNEKLVIRYLLGELPEEEQIRIEERFFADDEYFEQLLAIEDELIDNYVKGELTDREREQFEKYFLASPKRRQRVEFARTLMRAVSQASVGEVTAPSMPQPEPVSWWQPLLAPLAVAVLVVGIGLVLVSVPPLLVALGASLLIGWFIVERTRLRGQLGQLRWLIPPVLVGILVGGLLLIYETMRLRDQLGQLQVERAELQRHEQELLQQAAKTTEQREANEQLSQQLQRERQERERLEQEVARLKQARPGGLAFALFPPDPTRGIEAREPLVIPEGEESVLLRLYLTEESQYRSYRAVIQTPEGEEKWSQDRLKAMRIASGRAVILNVPARVLTEGDHIATLNGITASGDLEIVDRYPFNVVKR